MCERDEEEKLQVGFCEEAYLGQKETKVRDGPSGEENKQKSSSGGVLAEKENKNTRRGLAPLPFKCF